MDADRFIVPENWRDYPQLQAVLRILVEGAQRVIRQQQSADQNGGGAMD